MYLTITKKAIVVGATTEAGRRHDSGFPTICRGPPTLVWKLGANVNSSYDMTAC
jgi:hypothetical protein